MKTTVVERDLARATLYKLLSLSFSYPDEVTFASLQNGVNACAVAAEVAGDRLRPAAEAFRAEVGGCTQAEIAGLYRSLFTFSASPDCPLNECAYSSKHTYQETQELADISGFYQAFGLEIASARPDDLSVELEFCYLLALKEAHALEHSQRAAANVCRATPRSFLHDHLARWAENIGRRLELLAARTPYAAFGSLLSSFISCEVEQLKVGTFSPYQEIPHPPEAPEDEECAAGIGAGSLEVQEEDFLGELVQVSSPGRPSGG